MYCSWVTTLIVAAAAFHSVAAATSGRDDVETLLLTPRAFRPIPRPGRVPDNFTPPDTAPPPRLGDRPKPGPGDDLDLPRRPTLGGDRDGPNAPTDNSRDAYVPPAIPDLSRAPSKVSNKGSSGEADRTYHPCSPKRYDENECLELIGVAVDLLQELIPDPEESPTDGIINTLPTRPVATTTMSKVFQDLAVETGVAVMPNLNMSEWMSGTKYVQVYTPQEFGLLRDDPLCFFAVYERIYRAYASLEVSSTTDSAQQPSSTSRGPSRRQIGCNNAPELCKSPEDKARTLYLGYIPDQIHLVYKHTPTEVTVKETGTTSCQGFTLEDQVTIPAFSTTYGVFEYRAGQSPTPEPTQTPPVKDDNLVKDDAARGASLSMAILGFSVLFAFASSML